MDRGGGGWGEGGEGGGRLIYIYTRTHSHAYYIIHMLTEGPINLDVNIKLLTNVGLYCKARHTDVRIITTSSWARHGSHSLLGFWRQILTG